jgi:hypothetical protein
MVRLVVLVHRRPPAINDVCTAAAGDLLEPTDYWPPRYRVRGFPTAEQLQAMGAGPMGE